MADQDPNSLDLLKKDLFDYVRLMLGDEIVDVELDPSHLEAAYQRALGIYRQRAENAFEESYMFLELKEFQSTYQLPQEVQTVRQAFRRTIGNATGPFSTSFDPFSSATLNTYLLTFNASGGLATYDYYTQYVELAARMFGGFLNYTYNRVTKKLTLVRSPRGNGEQVLLWTYNLKPEFMLLSDFQIVQWFRDCVTGVAKMIIGEAREKFASIAGPQGGTALNGASMKAEGQQEVDKSIENLKLFVDGSAPLTWVIG